MNACGVVLVLLLIVGFVILCLIGNSIIHPPYR